MLWMKAWLETRWRFLYALGLPLGVIVLFVAAGLRSAKQAPTMMFVLSSFSIFAAVYLAGTGVRTQSPFQGTKGLHGSTYFTLSLPVSRFRLLAVRTGVGFLEIVGINAIMIGLAWALFPLVRADSTPIDLLETILSAVLCTACLYSMAVLLATFLEETWHMLGSLILVGISWWGLSRLSLRPSFNVFRFLGAASPIVTRGLPWPAIGISLFVSAVLLWIALKILQVREY